MKRRRRTFDCKRETRPTSEQTRTRSSLSSSHLFLRPSSHFFSHSSRWGFFSLFAFRWTRVRFFSFCRENKKEKPRGECVIMQSDHDEDVFTRSRFFHPALGSDFFSFYFFSFLSFLMQSISTLLDSDLRCELTSSELSAQPALCNYKILSCIYTFE